ncbi:MAG: glycerol kinase, partial [Malacoplasma sp.]|nr:glycerol kinase [Malacoplasma sp.]
MDTEKKYVVAIDSGTTSCRTIIFDKQGKSVAIAQAEFTQFFPQSGWVEHDQLEILSAPLGTLQSA